MSNDQGADAEAYLRRIVPVMRSLGVVSWDAITLGPEPVKHVPVVETAADKRQTRLDEARQEMRDRLAAVGTYTDEQIDKFLPPELFED